MHTSRRQTLRTLLLAPLAAWFLPKQGQAQESHRLDHGLRWEEEIVRAAKLLPPGSEILHLTLWNFDPKNPEVQIQYFRPGDQSQIWVSSSRTHTGS